MTDTKLGIDGAHYATPLDGGRGFLDIVSVERMRHPMTGWTARYLSNVDAWHVTTPYGAARTYSRHARPATPWTRSSDTVEHRRTYALGRGVQSVARGYIVTDGEPDRVRVDIVTSTGRALRTRYFIVGA
jgi:hypothetical protein